MSRTPVAEVTVPVQLHGKRGNQQFRSAQVIAREKVQSQEPTDEQISNNLDDMTFLRLPDVKAVTGLSKTSIYALIREKSFPAPVRLGARAVAWVRSEVKQWAVDRVHASRSAA